ncbi:UMP kinase [Brevibacillus laterosporus]|uniref:Uridylate kinase n=2 Tax=Brevibacillus laterosporus TaxID=1465 RepID=A0AAP3DK04_BRELA|nr:UMP kinase [Brevibacillus laterosporus]ATO48731.1 UMP kinase [Brevibacillus laterosporus DSM 25]AYB41239.1 UMP kinase [Brevibacillus laterosporus]MBG9772191.1 uridylate kinase [Brevibacillus laterosporus]MBG9796875.1 uridylate kinase [Brevibacillus laterosporus]MBG9804425.1 uridylate kinase [Brevibacillus laterosporus]
MPRYKRVLVKLSGGAVAGDKGFGFEPSKLTHIADEVEALLQLGVEVAIVIGGGNIFRGNMANEWAIGRVEADNIGTMATVINSLMLRGVLNNRTDHEVRVMTANPINSVAEPYIRLRAMHHLEKGHVIIFAGGNGQPYVTTDYPAVQRALEMEADAILVAKHGVDGVLNGDPRILAKTKLYESLSYDDVIRQGLKVMDQSAIILARDYALPIHVFNFDKKHVMKRICEGENLGTLVSDQVDTVLSSH